MSTPSAIPATAATVAPIGIFDSGLGGLSVLRACARSCPTNRSSTLPIRTMRRMVRATRRSLRNARWQSASGWPAKGRALVIACNTATARAIATVREHLSMPLVGVEPGIKPAAAVSASGVAGPATQSTLNSPRFQALLDRYGAGRRFICQPGHGPSRPSSAAIRIRPRCARCSTATCSRCSTTAPIRWYSAAHYPFFTETIRDLVGERLTLVDTNDAIARQLVRVLDERHLRAPAGTRAAPPASARPATAASCRCSPRRCSASLRRSNPSPFPRRTRAPARPPDTARHALFRVPLHPPDVSRVRCP